MTTLSAVNEGIALHVERIDLESDISTGFLPDADSIHHYFIVYSHTQNKKYLTSLLDGSNDLTATRILDLLDLVKKGEQ